jgi:hypothetical protein
VYDGVEQADASRRRAVEDTKLKPA